MVKTPPPYPLKYFIRAVKNLLTHKPITRVKMTSSEDFVEDVVCKVSDLQENQLKTFKLTDKEVLLVKQNNVISALGTKCTHYGAPLVNGAVGIGRIRCPWHGACFNISTGDIEDFPGMDSLPCYQVTIEGDNVKVKARQSDLVTNKRIKSMVGKCSAASDSIVVIGGGPAAAVCVETLRQEEYRGDITMICKENLLPYDRAKCSKQLDMDITAGQFRDDQFYQKYNINVLKGVEAKALDTKNKKIMLSNDTDISYSKLFIATGNQARKPSIPGVELSNVFVLRNYEDARKINSALSKDINVVVIGSSFVGIEVTDFCVDKVKKVTVLMQSSTPFINVLGKRIGETILQFYKKKGVEFIPSTVVKKMNSSGHVESVTLADGNIIPANVVVMGIGGVPNTAFLKDSGIQIESNGTISANTYLESNIPNVYVGGDIAFAPVWCNNNAKAAIGHIGLAHYHGRIAGLNMSGKATELRTVPYFWTKIGSYFIRYCGIGPYDEIVYLGEVEDFKFVAFYLKDDIVVAMSSCRMDPLVSKYAELRAQGKKITREQVTSCDPLSWTK